nr:unnamed protein product [Callosobruchus analis]
MKNNLISLYFIRFSNTSRKHRNTLHLSIHSILLSSLSKYKTVLAQNGEKAEILTRNPNGTHAISNLHCREGYVRIYRKCRPIDASANLEEGPRNLNSITHVPCRSGYVYIHGKCREIVGNINTIYVT